MKILGTWAAAACVALTISGCGGGGSGGTSPPPPAPVAVPNVVADSQAAATTAITAAGLVVGTVTMQASSTVASGNVISESPAAGTSVTKGSAVNLVVSSGPPPVAVPNVVGGTQAAATTAITGAGLVVGAVTMQSSSTVASGNVISENPAAGASVAHGSAVNLVVSSGPAQVAVPNVAGKTQAAAVTAITGAGLTLGTVTQASSTTVPVGSVISENPSAGTSVVVGSAVNLVISSSFTPVSATMTSVRFGHTATLLPNGQVLLTGGLNAFGQTSPALDTAELYNPTAGTFTALTATMTSLRDQHAATLLPNGQVLITGGSNNLNGNGMVTAELYNPATQAFTALTATMTTPRGGHTATLLSTGQVLITGGFNDSATALNTAELYDPVANTFTPLTATMTSPRSNHTATLLPNGQVLLTGGGSNHVIFNTAEVYDPVAQTFTAVTATMTTPRSGHTATLLPNGQVLLTGGVASSFSTTALTTLGSTEVYDPVANTFTPLTATLTTSRGLHTATLLATGLVLLTGGATGSGGAPTALSTAEVYEALPASLQTFTALTAAMTSDRAGHTATLLPNGHILLTGGCIAIPCTTALSTAELYDPTADTFTAVTATMITARAFHTATLLANGQVLLTGGWSGVSGTVSTALASAEVYDPVANTFTALTATMTTARALHTASSLPNGKVLIAGGEPNNAGGNILNTAEVYDPVANTFTALTATMSAALSGHTATLLPSGQVLFTGGVNNAGTTLNTAEVYDPTANTFTALTATMTTALAGHAAALLPNGQVLLSGGGQGGTFALIIAGALNTAELFNPATNTFTAITATMTSTRALHKATLMPNGQVLVTGGAHSPSTILNTAEEYAP